MAPPDHRRSAGARLRDAVHAADPGGARTRTAARALVASGVALAVGWALAGLAGQGLRPLAHAVAVAFIGAVTLPSPLPRGHLVRLGLLPGVVAAVFAVARPGSVVALTGFVVLATALAALARWGLAARAIGLQALLAGVLSLRLGLTAADALAAGVAALVGAGALGGTWRWLVPERPAAAATRELRALRAQLGVLVDAVAVLVAEGPGDRRQRRVRLRLVAVQEQALVVDGALAPGEEACRRAVLTCEALADHLTWSALTLAVDTSRDDRFGLAGAIRQLRGEVDPVTDDAGGVAALVPDLTGVDDQLLEVLARLAVAAEDLRGPAAAVRVERPSFTPDPAAPVRALVVQTFVATVGGLLLGLLVATDEWYWSVLGAWIVVNTTTSRGAGVRKGVDRVVGTAVGVLGGLALGALLADATAAAIAVLLVALGAVAWVFRVSYRVTMAALTIAVALLSELSGILTTRLLVLRLAETAVGVVVAGLVVWLVLPTRTRATVDAAVDGLLGALDELLAGLARDGRVDAVGVRAVDRAVSALRATTAPLLGGNLAVTLGGTGGDVRAARLLATAVRVRVGALATATATTETPPSPATVAAVRRRLADLRGWLAADGPLPVAEDAPDVTGEVGRTLLAIDDRLVGYASARGLTLRVLPGALVGGSADPRD